MARNRWILVCVFLCIIALPVSAAPSRGINEVTRLDITNSTLVACNYSQGFIQGRLIVVAYNASNGIENPSGTPLPFSLTLSSGVNSATFNIALTSDDVLPYGILLSNQNLSSVTITVSAGAVSTSITYDCEEESSVSADSRLNLGAGDLINALYNATDVEGQPVIAVWEVQSNSAGIYIDSFPYTMFEPYLATLPAENTLLGTLGDTRLYALTTGEFQLVVGPDNENKTYTTVFSGLPASGVYYPNP